MTVFLLFAALMLAAALFFVLPPLLSRGKGVSHVQRDVINLDILRDQLRELDVDRATGTIDEASYASARRDLEQRVAEEVRPQAARSTPASGKPWSAIAVGVLLPLVAGGLYLYIGNRDALDPSKMIAPQQQQAYSQDQIDGILNKIAQHLKEKPDDAEGWQILGSSYVKLGRLNEAVDAYANLARLKSQDPEVLGVYAVTMGMANKGSLQGEPEKILAQALALDPKNIRALALTGSARYERRDYTGAITQWRKILAIVPPESDTARMVASSIDQALSLSGMPADTKPASASALVASSAPATIAGSVSGTVELDPALRAKVADTDAVFIFARAVGGPPMPLAVLKKQVKDLPLNFVLDDSMSMMPSAKLSAFPNVVVSARVSKSGNPIASPGDYEGVTATIHPGMQGLKIQINTPSK